MKVLVVEDDERIAQPLQEHFQHQQNLVVLESDGRSGLIRARSDTFDLILLDLMLPELDGLSVCRTLRSEGCSAAIIIITAIDKTANKITGLDAGADDYLVKPFDIDELSARVRAVFRRNQGQFIEHFHWQDLSVDCGKHIATYLGRTIDLTPTEFRLLCHFMANPNRTYAKQELVEKLWSDNAPSDAVVKAHIKGLRNKLHASGAPKDLVTTVYGFGYRLKQHDQ